MNEPENSDDNVSKEIWRRFKFSPEHLKGREAITELKGLNNSVAVAAQRIPNLSSAVSKSSENADKELSLADIAHDGLDHTKASMHLTNAANHISDAATMIVGEGQSALNNLTTVPQHLSSGYYTLEASLHMLEGQEALSNLMDVAHLGKAHEHVRNYVESIPKGK